MNYSITQTLFASLLLTAAVVVTGCSSSPTTTGGWPVINGSNGNIDIRYNPGGTPKKLPGGKNVNIFGEYENPDFENYHPEGCDPKYENYGTNLEIERPSTGTLPDKSVDRLCLRGAPVVANTAEEMVRIVKPGGTVTIAGPDPATVNTGVDRVEDELGDDAGGTQSGQTNVSGVTIYWTTIKRKPK